MTFFTHEQGQTFLLKICYYGKLNSVRDLRHYNFASNEDVSTCIPKYYRTPPKKVCRTLIF